jgi:hypothetical protein
MLLEDALVEYFMGNGEFSCFGIRHLNTTYDWKLPLTTAEYVDLPVNLSNYDANVRLKFALHSIWTNEPKKRTLVTKWVISDWGGIRGNSDEKLAYYSREAQKKTPNTPLSGIASFSKVLAISDPNKFAILDARIVVSLTAIQVISDVDDGVLFPYLPGRNLVTGHTARKLGFSQTPEFSHNRLLERFRKWCAISNNEAYEKYLQLLKIVVSRPEIGCGILPLEMALFADAERLAKLCIYKNSNHLTLPAR